MTDSIDMSRNPECEPRMSVVTVTFNSGGEIEAFVCSLGRQGLDTRLWLIDNASTDDTPAMLMRLAREYNWIKARLNETNIGLAAANNLPLTELTGDYTAIVNPDIVLHPGALSALADYLDAHPDVVAVAPVNVSEDGTPHTSFHRRWTLAHLFVWRMLPAALTQWLYGRIRTYGEQNVLFASGACLVVRTDAFQRIGGYDPEYFLTVEDVCDLCIRLREGDCTRRVIVTPVAQVTHLRSRSAVAVPFITLWNGARGSVYHFHKHGGPASGLAAYVIVASSSLMRLLLALPGAVFSARRRCSLRYHWQVLWQLVRDNPLRIKTRSADG